MDTTPSGESSRGVLCADHHKGYSMPIGGVVASDRVVMPAGVGYDIGCGNCAVQTRLTAADLDVPKVMDEICRVTGAQACVFVCGERPGLGFADSMSAYYMYNPPSGNPTDADREVISNINPRGLEPAKAAVAVAEACQRILQAKKSGVILG